MLLYFFVTAGTTVAVYSSVPAYSERLLMSALGALMFMAAGAALWFIGLQVFVVRRFCAYCILVQVETGIESGQLRARQNRPF
jgi:uncharacterized membrane protein